RELVKLTLVLVHLCAVTFISRTYSPHDPAIVHTGITSATLRLPPPCLNKTAGQFNSFNPDYCQVVLIELIDLVAVRDEEHVIARSSQTYRTILLVLKR